MTRGRIIAPQRDSHGYCDTNPPQLQYSRAGRPWMPVLAHTVHVGSLCRAACNVTTAASARYLPPQVWYAGAWGTISFGNNVYNQAMASRFGGQEAAVACRMLGKAVRRVRQQRHPTIRSAQALFTPRLDLTETAARTPLPPPPTGTGFDPLYGNTSDVLRGDGFVVRA